MDSEIRENGKPGADGRDGRDGRVHGRRAGPSGEGASAATRGSHGSRTVASRGYGAAEVGPRPPAAIPRTGFPGPAGTMSHTGAGTRGGGSTAVTVPSTGVIRQ